MKKRILCYIGKSVYQKGLWEGNSGNYLFNLSLETALANANTEVSFYPLSDFESHSPDFVNNNFDLVLYSAANIINRKCKDFFLVAASQISKYKVPIFFIGAGLETKIYDYKFKFVDSFKTELSYFIDAVAKVGGAFSLRGERTAFVFKKLGFDNFKVTGCPSIFMFGPDMSISFPSLTESNFKPLINGTAILKNPKLNYAFNKYKNSIFICQDRFYKILYERDKHPFRYHDFFIKARFGSLALNLLNENRIKLFKDIPVWFDYLKNNGYNFSFGSRIHGNIVPLLCNIPVLIYTDDMRVLELAEFFDIPYLTKIPKSFDLLEAYNNLDYSKFNAGFKTKFRNFQNFFDEYNIPCRLGQAREYLLKLN